MNFCKTRICDFCKTEQDGNSPDQSCPVCGRNQWATAVCTCLNFPILKPAQNGVIIAQNNILSSPNCPVHKSDKGSS